MSTSPPAGLPGSIDPSGEHAEDDREKEQAPASAPHVLSPSNGSGDPPAVEVLHSWRDERVEPKLRRLAAMEVVPTGSLRSRPRKPRRVEKDTDETFEAKLASYHQRTARWEDAAKFLGLLDSEGNKVTKSERERENV